MPTPYEANLRVATGDTDVITAVDFPSRCTIRRVAIFDEENTNAFTADFYSRLFTGPLVDIARIRDNGSTKVLLETADPLVVRVDDPVTLASTGVGGYDVSHIITSVDVQTDSQGKKRFIYETDQAYTSDVTGAGTAQLLIPDAQQFLYQVLTQQTANGSGELLYFPDTATAGDGNVYFVNDDPENPDKEGRKTRKLYLKLSTDSTFRVQITAAIATTDD